MAHYYIVAYYLGKDEHDRNEKSKVHCELIGKTEPPYGSYKPNDPKIADQMATIRYYLSDHIKAHGGLLKVEITDDKGKIPTDEPKPKKEKK